MKVLSLYNKNLLALRSHQWKYHLDPYVGCGFACLYCIRRRAPAGSSGGGTFKQLSDLEVGPAPMSTMQASQLVQRLREDLAGLAAKQVILIGLASDPYQRMEADVRLTRGILEVLLAHDRPVVILTKSPLVLRDLDLLLELNSRGNLLVQFTLITTDDRKAGILEANAPSPAARLKAAEQLSRRGVPVHFHVAPYIPSFYTAPDLRETVKAIADHGGTCLYTNPLGVHPRRRAQVAGALARVGSDVEGTFFSLYPPTLARSAVLQPRWSLLVDEMQLFRETCESHDMTFVCEFIPGLTSLRAERFSTGVFRFGLPAVYQMLKFWNNRADEPVGWSAFRGGFLTEYPAVDQEYEDLVRGYWDSGELFENTNLMRCAAGGQVVYAAGSTLTVRDPRPDRPFRAWVLGAAGRMIEFFGVGKRRQRGAREDGM